jgi:cell division transport system permease protein
VRKKINIGIFFVKEAFKNMFSSPLLSIISILTIAVSLCLVGFFFVITMNAKGLLEKVREGLKITIYLKEPMSENEISTFMDEIKKEKGVSEIKYISKTEDRERNRALIPDSLSKTIDEEFVPAQHCLEIVLQDSARAGGEDERILKWIKTILQVDFVAEPPLGIEKVRIASSVMEIFRLVGIIMSVVIMFAALFFVVSVINLSINRRKEEIEITKLVGATNFFIRMPFIIEGFLQGLSGSLLSTFAVICISNIINQYVGDVLFLNVKLEFFPDVIFVWLLAGGVGIGVLGTFFSVGRYLKI